MNYSELKAYARDGGWFARHKALVDSNNQTILAQRQKYLYSRLGFQVGDFVIEGEGDEAKVKRIAYVWSNDDVQLCHPNASFYLGEDYVSMSGSLEPTISTKNFEATGEFRFGSVWFFSENMAQAHNGVYTSARFRVWRTK